MSTATMRMTVHTLTLAVCLVVVLDAGAALRVPIVLAFGLTVPGLIATSHIEVLTRLERAALTPAISISVMILGSVLLAAFDGWTGDRALAIVAASALLTTIPFRLSEEPETV
jgi:hypothetical protein